ncbi:unnamed protein product [Nesidiocoris tenuis]|uniref:Uncharacterized protein n=1 Tax=Nesidiocoris tenuis TaxID=355587 RepID=A0A6H5GKJ9_9HEMI|nr:unnamed protein product [Nesidiocoris tenuis]
MIFVAALSIASALAEPPVNNGYLPPPTSSPGYSYPTPNRPLNPSPPAYRPTPAPSPPAYRPPAPTPPRPSYGPPPSPPAYRPPAPPPPPPPRPTYTPAPPAPPAPAPTYGQPQADVGYKPVGPPAQRPIVPGGNIVNDISPGYGQESHDHHHHEPGMPFDFNYAVKDDYYGTDYSHNAVSDGDVVRGEYKVLLPDGRLQIVSYTADWKNGFNADVKYQGEPTYPAAPPANRPAGPPGGGYPAAGPPSGPPAPPAGGGYPSGPPSGPAPPSGGY